MRDACMNQHIFEFVTAPPMQTLDFELRRLCDCSTREQPI
jgi:hypothetical protein